jgi:hypothetical protein
MATRRHTLYTTTTFYKKAGGTPTSATTCQPRPAPHLRGRGRRLHNLTAATISYSAAARANESSVLDRISITCALVIHRPRGIASKELTIRFWRSSAEKTKRGALGAAAAGCFQYSWSPFHPVSHRFLRNFLQKAANCTRTRYPTGGSPFTRGRRAEPVRCMAMHRTLALFAVTAAAGATRHAGDSRDVKSGDRNERAAAVNHTVSQIWQHGEGGCTCIGVPALIHTRNATVPLCSPLPSAACGLGTDACPPKRRRRLRCRAPAMAITLASQ